MVFHVKYSMLKLLTLMLSNVNYFYFLLLEILYLWYILFLLIESFLIFFLLLIIVSKSFFSKSPFIISLIFDNIGCYIF